MAEQVIPGLQPQRLSDDEAVEYVPKEHVVTGCSVDSATAPPATPPAEQTASVHVATNLLAVAIRAAHVGKPRTPLEFALLRAAATLLESVHSSIKELISQEAGSPPSKALVQRGKKA